MNNFNFNRDFYEGCRALGDREGMALAWAMLRYGYEGIEPKLKPTTMAAFTFARGRIDAMVNGSLGGQARAAKAGGIATTQGGSQGGVQGGSRPSGRGGSQQKEKEKEIALAGYSAARQAPDGFEPPSAEDVEAYFAANCLRGDARQFFDQKARKLAYTAAVAAYGKGEAPDVDKLLEQMREKVAEPSQTETNTANIDYLMMTVGGEQ